MKANTSKGSTSSAPIMAPGWWRDQPEVIKLQACNHTGKCGINNLRCAFRSRRQGQAVEGPRGPRQPFHTVSAHTATCNQRIMARSGGLTQAAGG